jgi:hypothetical protein
MQAAAEGWPYSVLVFHTQNAKVTQGALDHIEDLIIALGVWGFHEKSGFDHVAKRILHHALETLLVIELDTHPKPPNRRTLCEELDLLVIFAPVKTLYEEHSLERIERQ